MVGRGAAVLLESGDALQFPIFQDFEILLLQAREGLSLAIAYDNIDHHETRSGLKSGTAVLFSCTKLRD